MPCPTCSHTMQAVGKNSLNEPVFWCPRCGTLKTCEDADRPKLIERCRRFGATLSPAWKNTWRKLGIEESIDLPTNRV